MQKTSWFLFLQVQLLLVLYAGNVLFIYIYIYIYCIFWPLIYDFVRSFKVSCHYFIEKRMNIRLVVINVGNPVEFGVMHFQYVCTFWFETVFTHHIFCFTFVLSALVYCRFLFFLGVQRIPVLRTLLVELHTTEILGIWMQVT
jgi:hypothetical protein